MADGMVQCSTCGKTLSTMQSARRHYNLIHAKDTIDMATCPICQKQFSGKSYVDDHMRKTHKISKKMWKKSCGNLSQILAAKSKNLFHSCILTLLSKQMKYRIQFYLGCRFFFIYKQKNLQNLNLQYSCISKLQGLMILE